MFFSEKLDASLDDYSKSFHIFVKYLNDFTTQNKQIQRSMSKGANYTEKQLQIARFAKAMSHPVRVCILEKLSKMNACCYSGDIAEELNIGRSALSLHLKELKHAGLIEGTTELPYIKYCIHRENWHEVKQLYLDFLGG